VRVREPGASRAAHVWRASGQRGFELREIRAEHPRGIGAGHTRRAGRAREREHALFDRQLRVSGEPHSPVPLVNTAPVRAQQAARHLGRLRRVQARHRLELRPQRPFSQVFEQGGGRRRVYPGPGQDSA
jgi:hypothetical protein